MCQHSRAHPDWNCLSAEGHLKPDNDFDHRYTMYHSDLGDALGEIPLGQGRYIKIYWGGVVIVDGENSVVLADAMYTWGTPKCGGECGNCQPNGQPKRAPRV